MGDKSLKIVHGENVHPRIEQRKDDSLAKMMSKMSNTWQQDKKKSDGLRTRIRHPSPLDSFARRKGTLLTAQDLHTNSSFHLFLKSARLSGTPTRLSSWSLITYDRTFDHTSAGRGTTGLGWGNKGSKMKLPGVRASGLGCRKMAGVSVYVLAMLMICVSELTSVSMRTLGVVLVVQNKRSAQSESD